MIASDVKQIDILRQTARDLNCRSSWVMTLIAMKFDLSAHAIIKTALAFVYLVMIGCSLREDVRLLGAGASAPAQSYQRWAAEFTREFPNVEVSYESLGSERGLESLAFRTVDFAVTEFPLAEKALQTTYEIPIAIDAIVLVARIVGIEAINLTHDLVAEFFSVE